MSVSNAMKASFVDALLEELELECEPAIDLGSDQADAIYMSACDIFLTREDGGGFVLTIDHRGEKSEVRLRASVDANGAPRLTAHIN